MKLNLWPMRAALLPALLLAAPCLAQQAAPAAKTEPALHPASDYIRVHDSEDGEHVTLQIAIRSFEPSDPKLPVVHLVGAVHIADKSYYQSLQKFLDEQDLVLFEGVKPAESSSDLANADDAAKAKVTKSRQRFLAVMMARYKAEHHALPGTFDALFAGVHGTMARLGVAATKDGWGNPQQFKVVAHDNAPDSFDLVSLGADNTEGGEGAGADIRFSDQKPLTKDEVSSTGEGIQVKMASALGLEFQLVGIDYNRPKWRNSDLTIGQLEDKLKEAGMNGSALFSMLDGSSLTSKFVGFLLGMVGSSPEGSMMLKTMMVEMLANADQLMDLKGDQLGKGMGQFMKVLVVDRNAAVFADLEKVIKTEPDIRSVALFFGAGHLPDMERRLDDMGYRLSASQWKDAIDVDLTRLKGGKAQARQMREMITKMIESQRKAAAKPAAGDRGDADNSHD